MYYRYIVHYTIGTMYYRYIILQRSLYRFVKLSWLSV